MSHSQNNQLLNHVPWQRELAARLRTPAQMAEILGASPNRRDAWDRVAAAYPVSATDYYLSLAQTRDPEDPILMQCLPDPAELEDCASAEDPLSEEADSPVPGMVHRYADRVLLVATNQCAVRCRHCLRKRIWREPPEPRIVFRRRLNRALQYIAETPTVREVLVSGGDPLVLPDDILEEILHKVRAIDHIGVIRVGTRCPAVLPSRITPGLCDLLHAAGPTWVATQFNHPLELSEQAAAACRRLADSGIPVVNQTVLLHGVNDGADTLEALFRGLTRLGVKPYYLFYGDPVRGTTHFRTGIERALEIVATLERRLSGLSMPIFAVDMPGGGGKIPLTAASRVERLDERTVALPVANGRLVHYPDHRPRENSPGIPGIA